MIIDTPIIESSQRLSKLLGVEFYLARDDLLPFPLAGNKYRKIKSEAAASSWAAGDLIITNGGVTSNHCRTVAQLAAEGGFKAHLVLHGDPSELANKISLEVLSLLGATYEVVLAPKIASAISRAVNTLSASGKVHVLPGGCHTPAGAQAYALAAEEVARLDLHSVFVASGTGATQAGIIAGLRRATSGAGVFGISVARSTERGSEAVRECLGWLGLETSVRFDDRFVDGGYGLSGHLTHAAVRLGWAHGLPLDATYTGKAFAGLLAHLRNGSVPRGARVLFWHTGGLMNQLESLSGRPKTVKA